jgi:predicted dehydrogenase
MKITRRKFLNQVTKTAGVISLVPVLEINAQPNHKKYKAVVIGRTGGGDYGHGYDLVFNKLENVEVVAVADLNPAGLKKAADKIGVKKAYTDYREMLEKEKPDLVSIAMRHPDCHAEIAAEACKVARGIIMEKPMTETIEDADKIVAASEKYGTKILVAHNRRWTEGFINIKYLIEEGLIGEIREVHFHGKQDHRSGGEDLIVLGTHDFDLMRFYFGDPLWCYANVRVDGRDAVKSDVRKGAEPMLVAGDTIFAMFGFKNNLVINWASVKRGDHWNTNFSKREKWAFEILGTKGIIAYQSGLDFAWLDSPFLAHKDATTFKDLPKAKKLSLELHQKNPVLNLIYAIENNTQPVCNVYDGRWTIEMVSAVYQSHISKKRIDLPLKDRRDPLRNWA